MMDRRFNPTIIEEGLGALAIAGSIVTSPLLRPWYSKRGATTVEVEMTNPGDKLMLIRGWITRTPAN
jgi:hypothetical protein